MTPTPDMQRCREAAMADARKALKCLFVAVDESIANDVQHRVEAAFAAMEAVWSAAQAQGVDAEAVERERFVERAYKLFYGDDKTLGEVAEALGCGIYDLSPWLTRSAMRFTLGEAAPTPPQQRTGGGEE